MLVWVTILTMGSLILLILSVAVIIIVNITLTGVDTTGLVAPLLRFSFTFP